MRRRFSVAEAVSRKKPEACERDAPEGEDGADFETGWGFISASRLGSSREMLRFWRRENFGIGKELGGGELV